MRKKNKDIKFDISIAKQMTDAFAFSSGVHCRLHSAAGECLHEQGEKDSGCEFCRKFSEASGIVPKCSTLHSFAAFQSERFGGRYIYFCPLGMTFSASPIMAEGGFAGALIAGPVLMVENEDFFEGDIFKDERCEPQIMKQLENDLQKVAKIAPKKMGYISRQLFANAVYISDNTYGLFATLRDNQQQNLIGDYISSIKGSEEMLSYPIEKETELFNAVAKGDKATAGDYLNQILGYIFFYVNDPEISRIRVEELFVILARAAIVGGANRDQIFRISQQYMLDMRSMNTQEEFTRYLAKSLNRFTDLVFEMVDAKHSNVINGVISYIGSNYTRNITLDEVASFAGYSPSYFSRIFKEDMGKTFKEYLTELRIEKSKSLLLSGNLPMAEICHMVGFNDQSYFCKTFRTVTGVSPDKFRKRTRRIDTAKEYGDA